MYFIISIIIFDEIKPQLEKKREREIYFRIIVLNVFLINKFTVVERERESHLAFEILGRVYFSSRSLNFESKIVLCCCFFFVFISIKLGF